MNKSKNILVLVLAVFLALTTQGSAATPEQVEASIVNGTAWLAAHQNTDGSWNHNSGITGLALLKFI